MQQQKKRNAGVHVLVAGNPARLLRRHSCTHTYVSIVCASNGMRAAAVEKLNLRVMRMNESCTCVNRCVCTTLICALAHVDKVDMSRGKEVTMQVYCGKKRKCKSNACHDRQTTAQIIAEERVCGENAAAILHRCWRFSAVAAVTVGTTATPQQQFKQQKQCCEEGAVLWQRTCRSKEVQPHSSSSNIRAAAAAAAVPLELQQQQQ